MRKVTNNVFNEGLNKDLNPIVTPKNVLTDNLNGTLLTFNGDELVLQNDSGNTKIKVEGEDAYVHLSEGFFPLGMKEYGGVLYIISGKHGKAPDGSYDPEKDAIEIGSYPSPKNSSYNKYEGKDLTSLNFYTPYIINEHDFKSGRYIQFKATEDFPYSKYLYKRGDEDCGIVDIKLYLQLDNGVIDLTDNIWEAFNLSGSTKSHWILDNDFNYICPFTYKGKLFIQLELHLPELKLAETPYVKEIGDNFHIYIKCYKKDTKALYIDKYSMTCEDDRLFIHDSGNIEYGVFNNSVSASVDVKLESGHAKVEYFIIPNIKPLNCDLNYKEDLGLDLGNLPAEILEKLTIKGQLLLDEKYNNIIFKPILGDCNYTTKHVEYDAIILYGEQGPIDYKFEPIDSGKLYTLYRRESGISNYSTFSDDFFESNNLPKEGDKAFLGFYSIKNNKVEIEDTYYIEEAFGEFSDLITNVASNTIASEASNQCYEAYFKLRLSHTIPEEDLDNVDIYIVDKATRSKKSLSTTDGKIYSTKTSFEKVSLVVKIPGFLTFDSRGYSDMLLDINDFYNKVYDYALIMAPPVAIKSPIKNVSSHGDFWGQFENWLASNAVKGTYSGDSTTDYRVLLNSKRNLYRSNKAIEDDSNHNDILGCEYGIDLCRITLDGGLKENSYISSGSFLTYDKWSNITLTSYAHYEDNYEDKLNPYYAFWGNHSGCTYNDIPGGAIDDKNKNFKNILSTKIKRMNAINKYSSGWYDTNINFYVNFTSSISLIKSPYNDVIVEPTFPNSSRLAVIYSLGNANPLYKELTKNRTTFIAGKDCELFMSYQKNFCEHSKAIVQKTLSDGTTETTIIEVPRLTDIYNNNTFYVMYPSYYNYTAPNNVESVTMDDKEFVNYVNFNEYIDATKYKCYIHPDYPTIDYNWIKEYEYYNVSNNDSEAVYLPKDLNLPIIYKYNITSQNG